MILRGAEFVAESSSSRLDLPSNQSGFYRDWMKSSERIEKEAVLFQSDVDLDDLVIRTTDYNCS